jgi:single-strand DNA-binding protein
MQTQLCTVEINKRIVMSDKNNLFKLLIIYIMNTLRNKVSLIGRLGTQPEVTTFEKGSTLARFTLATNESYKDKSGKWQDNTQWHTINAWGPQAERAKTLLAKGTEIILEGKLVHQSYESKSGEKKFSTIIEASAFLVIMPKQETNEK